MALNILKTFEPILDVCLAEYRQLSVELDRWLPRKSLDTDLMAASWNLCGYWNVSWYSQRSCWI